MNPTSKEDSTFSRSSSGKKVKEKEIMKPVSNKIISNPSGDEGRQLLLKNEDNVYLFLHHDISLVYHVFLCKVYLLLT